MVAKGIVKVIVRVFDRFDHAEQARLALLDDGFANEAVALSVRAGEAGPVEGNFAVGNTPVESDAHVYDRNYRMAERSQCMMTVSADDAGAVARAVAILARFGGRDPDPAAR